MSDLYKLVNHKGWGKKLKFILPNSIFEPLRKLYNSGMKLLPYSLKYGFATQIRKNKYPYCVINEGDTVIQVGAPKDILLAGRSRAMHFTRLVGKSGKVLIVEPDEENCTAINKMARKNKLTEMISLAQVGAWSKKDTLKFLYSPEHPASNILTNVQDHKSEQLDLDNYLEMEVPVDTLDNLLVQFELSVPKLVSVTANGAELEIVNGLSNNISKKIPFISLAATGEGYVERMSELGYELIAMDDRGYTFKLKAN